VNEAAKSAPYYPGRSGFGPKSSSPDATFPLYYLRNPALQRAFESFWAKRVEPDGAGLQDPHGYRSQ
jgi:hypothetical protein